MLQGTSVTYTYDPETNDLRFDTHVVGDRHIIIDGKDTGGQVVRTAMSLAIKYGGGRSAGLADLNIRSKGKACMLYVQASMHTLKVGDTFTVKGGAPTNSDAPTYGDFQQLITILRDFLGVCFCIRDLSNSDGPQFLLAFCMYALVPPCSFFGLLVLWTAHCFDCSSF